MKRAPLRSLTIVSAAAVVVGCASLGPHRADGTFASVRPVLESNCVHCHGTNRLAHMPAFTDTCALARLIGPANWIVPGHPERSRIFQVATFADEQPGAMPPTGHAISRAELEALRAWITAGAPLPHDPPIVLTPRGEGPHSI